MLAVAMLFYGTFSLAQSAPTPDSVPAPSAIPAPTPVPAPDAVPAPNSVSTAAPALVASAPPTTPPPVTPAPDGASDAWVHLAVDYDGAWLEGRSRIDEERWRRLCAAPCDRALGVDDLDMRVVAPRMTPSNAFTVEPGTGAARLRVSGGSARAREFGLIGLAGGLPVTFAGVTLLGVGSIRSDGTERTAGIVALSIGAAAVLAALPLLVLGSTTVKNAEGRHVAGHAARLF
jgi:hypothetical protein